MDMGHVSVGKCKPIIFFEKKEKISDRWLWLGTYYLPQGQMQGYYHNQSGTKPANISSDKWFVSLFCYFMTDESEEE